MKARVAIQIGVTPQQCKVLKAAADAHRMPLASYVREAVLRFTEMKESITVNADGHFTDRPA